jgi:hypothetical protein
MITDTNHFLKLVAQPGVNTYGIGFIANCGVAVKRVEVIFNTRLNIQENAF